MESLFAERGDKDVTKRVGDRRRRQRSLGYEDVRTEKVRRNSNGSVTRWEIYRRERLLGGKGSHLPKFLVSVVERRSKSRGHLVSARLRRRCEDLAVRWTRRRAEGTGGAHWRYSEVTWEGGRKLFIGKALRRATASDRNLGQAAGGVGKTDRQRRGREVKEGFMPRLRSGPGAPRGKGERDSQSGAGSGEGGSSMLEHQRREVSWGGFRFSRQK